MHKKNGYKIEYAILGIVISLLIFLLSMLGTFSPIMTAAGFLFGDLQNSLLKFDNDWEESIYSLNNISLVIEKSDNLEKENLLLNSEVARLQKENLQLLSLAKQKENLNNYNSILARVQYYSEDHTQIVINKGTNNGVVKGASVVINTYLIGIVVESADSFSKVQMINSLDKGIPVKIMADNLNAIMIYDQTNGFIIKDLPVNYVFSAGKDIVTLGINSDYPYGLYLGKTSELISAKNDISQTIKIKYPLNLNNLEEVFVITK